MEEICLRQRADAHAGRLYPFGILQCHRNLQYYPHLCEHLECGEELRKEIVNFDNELGPRAPVKGWIDKLDLLDSFFDESQRLL